MNLATFRIRFPEFRSAHDDLVNPALAAAALSTSAADWGTNYDEAHGLLAADLLANSPFGKNARLTEEDGKKTNYSALRDALGRRVLPSVVVT